MIRLKPSLLILGSSSFLAKPLIDALKTKNKFRIICQSRGNLKKITLSNSPEISFLNINYFEKKYNDQIFKNCSYIVNFVNASALDNEELINFRSFIKNVLFISKASLIHISSASVYGNCKNQTITELSKCSPKSSYQKIKFHDENELKNIAFELKTNIFILRPTEIIGDNSLNARKFIKTYISSTFIKRYIIKCFYGKRVSHFVSSKYLIDNILKIIEGKVASGIYLVSQDINKLNNFFDICRILDSRICKGSKLLKNYYILPLHWFFKIVYKYYKRNQIPLYAKIISSKPIVDPKKYYYFERDLMDHINHILKT